MRNTFVKFFPNSIESRIFASFVFAAVAAAFIVMLQSLLATFRAKIKACSLRIGVFQFICP